MTPEKAFKMLLIREPFYGLVMSNLQKIYTTDDQVCNTAAVGVQGINLIFYLNTNFWNTLSDDEQIAILKHEMMHLCFKHIQNYNRFSDKNLANLACDCEINQYIKNLPKGCIFLHELKKEIPEFKNAPEKAGSKVYYDLFQKAADRLTPLVKQLLEDVRKNSGNHDHWSSYKESSVEGQLIINQIENILKSTAEHVSKCRGTIPGELQESIDALFKQKEAIFNWKAYLRRLLGNSIHVYTKKSMRHQSNRFTGSEGLKIKQKQRILVAIDTSGSVDNKELCDFFSEINHIRKTGAKIDLIQCDTGIRSIAPYNGAIPTIKGRGGTDFKPVIDFYNENRNLYSTCVFFTDGYAPIDFKVLKTMIWVITSEGYKRKYPGIAIYIPKETNN